MNSDDKPYIKHIKGKWLTQLIDWFIEPHREYMILEIDDIPQPYATYENNILTIPTELAAEDILYRIQMQLPDIDPGYDEESHRCLLKSANKLATQIKQFYKGI